MLRTPGFDVRRPAAVLALLVLAATLCCGLIGCSDDNPEDPGTPTIRHPEDFLPPATASMTTSGDPQVATDATALYALIDGGSTEYTNRGFQEVAYQVYTSNAGSDEWQIDAFIYDLTSSDNCADLLEAKTEFGTWLVLPGMGDAALHQVGPTRYQIYLRESRYFVELGANNISNDAQSLLQTWAAHIDQEIGD